MVIGSRTSLPSGSRQTRRAGGFCGVRRLHLNGDALPIGSDVLFSSSVISIFLKERGASRAVTDLDVSKSAEAAFLWSATVKRGPMGKSLGLRLGRFRVQLQVRHSN